MIEISKRILSIEMEAQNQPTFKPVRGKDYISYGEKNDYPAYIIDLFNRCSEHNAIITGKASYLFGKGLTYEKTGDPKIDAKSEKFISIANQFQSWNDLLPKTCVNFELIDGFYYQFVYGKNGKIVASYNLDFTRVRAHEDGKNFIYCEDWSDPKKVKEAKTYRAYNPNIKTGTCIYYCKVHRPSASLFGDTYSVPNYIGALSAIETDINVDLFFNSLTEHGMTAQGMLSLFNGEPSEEEQKQIKKAFEKKYTGPKKAGKFLFNFVDPNGKAAELLNFTSSDLDKQFEVLGKRNIQKIFTGHKVTNPIIFGIMQEGSLGNRKELLEAWEHFHTTYIKPRQEIILSVVRLVADNNGVNSSSLYLEELPPIGEEFELSEQIFTNTLTIEEQRNYLSEKKGVKLISFDDESTNSRLSLAQKIGVGGSQALTTLITNPQVLPDQKLNILMGLYSIPEKKARKMLGMIQPIAVDAEGNPVQMSAVKDQILEAFKLKAQEANEDEILEVKYVGFDSEGKAFEFEKAQYQKFSEVLGGTVSEVRNQILDIVTGDPFIKPEVIAKMLGTDTDYVQDQLKQMIDSGVLENFGKGFQITPKGLNRAENIEPVIETEIYTVYQYALSPKADYHNSKGYKDNSHEFCIDMMNMSNKGHFWTREDIDNISNEFDENAWIYRGGFTSRKGGDVTPWCNHVWKAITKVRKKNA